MDASPSVVAPPCWMVNPERVTTLEIVTTVLTPPPSMIVVLAPEPITFKLMLIVDFA